MNRWMLDTNTVSLLLHRRSPSVDLRTAAVGTPSMCVSAISYGETQFGLAKNPGAVALANAAVILFREIEIIPWNQQTSIVYGKLRANLMMSGKALSPLDMLIAAHALEAGAVLVSSDRAFRHVPGLTVEDWTT